MMEKYGVDMSNLPVEDAQIKMIKELSKEASVKFEMPKNRKEADKIIERMMDELVKGE